MVNYTLQADAVSATLSDAVCAFGVYVGNIVHVCLSGAMEVMFGGEGRVGV